MITGTKIRYVGLIGAPYWYSSCDAKSTDATIKITMSDFPITVIRCNTSSDEKFQSALSSFSNQQIFSSPVAAIQVLERQQSRIVMTECETEEVSCVKVAEATRDIDRENYHFT